MVESYRKWFSSNLGIEMDVLIFGHSGRPVILFPTSRGRYFENKDFKLIDAAASFLNEGKVKIYCPDGIDAYSFYNKGIHPAERIANHIRYDQFLLNELVPLTRHETGHEKIVTAGCSFGGFHAVNFAFRYPWVVDSVVSMSGAFDIRSQFDGFYNDDIYYNNPVDFVPNSQHPALWQMGIILGTTDRDICRHQNENFSRILSEKNLPHWLDIRENADHDWPIWRSMFPSYLAALT